jgi:methylenetetrahydrofolate dehydrogenase (NADP+)/methenyltetrahydrofolate cyclohydrolase
MTGKVLDGKALSKQIENELIGRVDKIKERRGGKPSLLTTILVGNDPASATYVKMKGNACKRIGMDSLKVVLPENTTTEELLQPTPLFQEV